jgi:hypothetical protein
VNLFRKSIVLLIIIFTIGQNLQSADEKNADKLKLIDQKIQIDGDLNESCWHLKHETFYTRENKEFDEVPLFCFLRDKENLYFGAKYILSNKIDSCKVGERDIYFRIRINTEYASYSFTVEPFDTTGNSCGRVTKYCHKSGDISKNFKFSSKVNDSIWSFEFAQPINELFSEKGHILIYELKYKNIFNEGNERSYFPKRDDYGLFEL